MDNDGNMSRMSPREGSRAAAHTGPKELWTRGEMDGGLSYRDEPRQDALSRKGVALVVECLCPHDISGMLGVLGSEAGRARVAELSHEPEVVVLGEPHQVAWGLGDRCCGRAAGWQPA